VSRFTGSSGPTEPGGRAIFHQYTKPYTEASTVVPNVICWQRGTLNTPRQPKTTSTQTAGLLHTLVPDTVIKYMGWDACRCGAHWQMALTGRWGINCDSLCLGDTPFCWHILLLVISDGLLHLLGSCLDSRPPLLLSCCCSCSGGRWRHAGCAYYRTPTACAPPFSASTTSPMPPSMDCRLAMLPVGGSRAATASSTKL
jgi:hypothetical protein